MTEPIFYGGSGAYDFQYLEFSALKYRHDEEWIQSDAGVSVADLIAIRSRLKEITEEKNSASRFEGTFEDKCRECLSIFSFGRDDLQCFDELAVDSFLNLFSTVPGSANAEFTEIGSYNKVDSHPIVRLGNDDFVLLIGFNLARSIYESPFYWMNSSTDYSDAASKHRGETTESIAFDLLVRTFGAGNVHKSVKILKSKNVVTDVDVLAVAGNKAVIVQAKSKR